MTSEYERKLIDMQYQMRENNAYLNDYLKDLNNWTDDIKKKEETLKTSGATAPTNTSADLPPVRSFVEPPKPKKKSKKKTTSNEKTSSSIRSYDYRGWDKFDVEAECERIDEETNEQDGGEESEEEDDDDTDEQWQAEVLKQKAEHYKKWGNHHFEKKNYAEAIESYTKAIECNPEVAVYFANRAQCQLFEQRYGACEADCTLAIQLDGNYLKAYYRRALARIQLGKTEPAREDLEYVLAREPANRDAKTKLDELNRSDEIKRLGRVYPLKDKPINQRSSKPLKRVEIQEIDTSILALSEPTATAAKKKSLVIEEIEPTEEPATVMETSAPPPPSLPSVPIEQRPPTQSVKLTVVEKPLPIPTTGFQFKRDWNSLNRQVEQQASYFERIPPTSYKTLFSTGLDSSVFSRILSFWSKKTNMDEHLIDSMFELRRTPRFDTQLSFLDQQDKHALKTLLQRLQAECVSSEKITTILNDYKID